MKNSTIAMLYFILATITFIANIILVMNGQPMVVEPFWGNMILHAIYNTAKDE